MNSPETNEAERTAVNIELDAGDPNPQATVEAVQIETRGRGDISCLVVHEEDGRSHEVTEALAQAKFAQRPPAEDADTATVALNDKPPVKPIMEFGHEEITLLPGQTLESVIREKHQALLKKGKSALKPVQAKVSASGFLAGGWARPSGLPKPKGFKY